jgi:effector-binding domain-containing protein
MPVISDYRVLSITEQPVLMITVKVKCDDLRRVVGEKRVQIEKYLGEYNEYLTDVPFVMFHNSDYANLEISICFPTRKPLPGKGEIRFSIIPSGRTVLCMLIGDENERAKLYKEIVDWIENNGYKFGGRAYEFLYMRDFQCASKDKILVKFMAVIK